MWDGCFPCNLIIVLWTFYRAKIIASSILRVQTKALHYKRAGAEAGTWWPRSSSPSDAVSASHVESLGLLRIKHEVLVLLLQDLGRLQQEPGPGWRIATTTAYLHHAHHASTKYPSSDTTQNPLGETSAMTSLQRRGLGLRVKSSELPRLMYLVRYRIWVRLCLASEF